MKNLQSNPPSANYAAMSAISLNRKKKREHFGTTYRFVLSLPLTPLRVRGVTVVFIYIIPTWEWLIMFTVDVTGALL